MCHRALDLVLVAVCLPQNAQVCQGTGVLLLGPSVCSPPVLPSLRDLPGDRSLWYLLLPDELTATEGPKFHGSRAS